MATSNSSMFPLRFLLYTSLLFSLLPFYLEKGHALGRRKTTESNYHTVQISSLLPASVCNPSTKGPNERASLKVVHRDGPCSEPSQGNAKAPSLTQVLAHDQVRVDSIQSRLAFNWGKNSLRDSQATLPAKSGNSLGSLNYIVTIGLGTPKKDLSLFFDTGSDLTWTQCEPCARECYKQQQPIFDPSKSTTYTNITCNSALCSQLKSATKNPPGCANSTCLYAIRYGDQSFSVGYFGKEKLTLLPTDVFDNFYFGCGQYNRGLLGSTAGLLGLGRDQLSIVSQTAQKYGKYFSYCLPSMSSSTGHLTFGNSGVPRTLQYTPMPINSQSPSFYFLEITAISVGGSQLSINPTVFKTAGSIIDSGTVITRLPPAAYSAMRTAFRQLMTKYPMTQPVSLFDTCYDISNYTTVSIPEISFYFAGNAKVDIHLSGTVGAVGPSQFCLAFAGNSDASTIGIFGNFQQKTFEVVYDVTGGKLGFGPGGCA